MIVYLSVFRRTVLLFLWSALSMGSILAQTNYASPDKACLRDFLRQYDPELRICNYPKVGLTVEDTLNWETSESWIEKIQGLSWTEESPKRISAIHLSGYSLTGSLNLSGLSALDSVDCSVNRLSSLDVSRNPSLRWLSCSDNWLISLDVSQSSSLEYLACYYNQLPSLDVSHMLSLNSLSCDNNLLTSLDVSRNHALEWLLCGGNQLTSLDVSHNLSLTVLGCHGNQLTSLDVSHNPSLNELSCSMSQLTSLDVSHNPELNSLSCYENQLTSLNLGQISSLSLLNCYSNKLSSLDISRNASLSSLICFENQLTSLNVSQNISLSELNCGGNQLTSLDISKNGLLNELNCSGNELKSLDISRNFLLHQLYCSANQLTFSAIPQMDTNIPYWYAPQKVVQAGQVLYPEGIDLTAEYRVKGNTTTFNWYEVMEDGEYSITLEGSNGLFTLDKSYEGKTLRCRMYNAAFPDFNGWPIVYEVAVAYSTSKYHPSDKACLRNFLRQYDLQLAVYNFSKVGLVAADTLNWETDESWIEKIHGLSWVGERPKRVSAIKWSSRIFKLSGSLDLSGFSALDSLDCSGNQLTSLDVSQNPSLSWLHCSVNPLISLDVSHNPKLDMLSCYSNQLTSLDVSHNPNLRMLNCHSNKLTSLDLSRNPKLDWLACGLNQLTFSTIPLLNNLTNYSYTSQGVTQGGRVLYSEGIDLAAEYSIKGNVTTFNWYEVINGNEYPVTLAGSGGSFSLDVSHEGKTLRCKMHNATFPAFDAEHPLVYEVDVINTDTSEFHSSDKTCLRNFLRQYDPETGICNFSRVGLIEADTLNWQTNEEWVRKVQGLTWNGVNPKHVSSIGWNACGLEGSLSLSGFPALETLSCADNQLTSLDVSRNPFLSLFNCSSNQLTSLDVRQNSSLSSLACADNQLISLDLSQNLSLFSLNCSSNPFTSLDLSLNISLDELSCDNNQLTSLNVTLNPSLSVLSCADNQLTFLDVSHNPNLHTFVCSSNQLTSLDVSQNLPLLLLNCSSNQLTSLDVTHNPTLFHLNCADNQLTSLDVSQNPNLGWFLCGYNQLTFSAIPLISNPSFYSYVQGVVQGGEVSYPEGIDLTAEYSIAGNLTTFHWYEVIGDAEQPITLEGDNGLFNLDKSYEGKTLRCKMYNATFPAFGTDPLVYEVQIVYPTGMQGIEVAEQGSLKVYPNPATNGKLTVEYAACSGDLPEPSAPWQKKIRVYDLSGSLVAVYSLTADGAKTEIDLSHLPEGSYIVQVGTQAVNIVR